MRIRIANTAAELPRGGVSRPRRHPHWQVRAQQNVPPGRPLAHPASALSRAVLVARVRLLPQTTLRSAVIHPAYIPRIPDGVSVWMALHASRVIRGGPFSHDMPGIFPESGRGIGSPETGANGHADRSVCCSADADNAGVFRAIAGNSLVAGVGFEQYPPLVHLRVGKMREPTPPRPRPTGQGTPWCPGTFVTSIGGGWRSASTAQRTGNAVALSPVPNLGPPSALS